MSDREAFLAGDRPDDVFIYLADDAVSGVDSLAAYGPMEFAGRAMGTEGAADPDCTGGTCPADDGTAPHEARFVFAFAEEQNEAAGDIYAEGDVVHAYVSCSCGEAYSDKWVAGAR